MNNAKSKRDMYQEVTNAVLELMDEHGADWIKPWITSAGANGLPYNPARGTAYKGSNVFWLLLAAHMHGFTSNAWGTVNQWNKQGCHVRKGEHHSANVVFFKKKTFRDWNPAKEEYETRQVPLIRWFPVFNADQVEGFEEEPVDNMGMTPVEVAEQWIDNTGAKFGTGPNAGYVPSADKIVMPPKKAFTSAEGYYATAFHELTHWTAPKGRCDRNMKGRFGDDTYAMEELVAEMGAAFQCVYLGVTYEPHADHAKYLNHWLKVLEGDKRAFMRATTKAQEAVDYLDSFQWEEEPYDAQLSEMAAANG